MNLTSCVVRISAVGAWCLAACSAPVAAGPIETIFSIAGHTPGAAQSRVPGSELNFTNFNNRMFRSPSSNLWLAVPTTDGTPATSDQVLIIGRGATAELVAREGVTEFATGEFVDFSSGIPVPRVADDGSWVHACVPQGSGLVGSRVFSASSSLGGVTPTFTVLARSNDELSGLPGHTWSAAAGAFHSPNVTADGTAAWAGLVFGAETTEAAVDQNGSHLALATFLFTPPGQADAAPVSDIDTNLFFIDGTGAHSIARAKLSVATTRDQVAIVDGSVVMQEGITTVGSLGTVSSITDVWMEPDGTWFIRGTAGGVDFIVRNGELIARVGGPILPGSGENWTAFQEVRGNARGEWAIVGTSSNPDALRNNVAVLGRRHVLARESDPIDLDRDGVPQSDLFVHSFRDRCLLMDDGYFIFTVRAKNAATATSSLGANAALVRVEACAADFSGDGVIDADDLADFINCFFSAPPCPLADFDGSGTTDADDLAEFINVFFSPCH